MSVIKANRKEGKLTVIVKARELCSYTVQICKNEKNFPKRERWILTQPIVNEALGIFTCLRRANAVAVDTPEDYKYRRSQQIQAYSMCEALLTLIEIAYQSLNLGSDRAEYWTGLVVDLEEYLKRWIRSDSKRYATVGESKQADSSTKKVVLVLRKLTK